MLFLLYFIGQYYWAEFIIDLFYYLKFQGRVYKKKVTTDPVYICRLKIRVHRSIIKLVGSDLSSYVGKVRFYDSVFNFLVSYEHFQFNLYYTRIAC